MERDNHGKNLKSDCGALGIILLQNEDKLAAGICSQVGTILEEILRSY